MKKNIRLYDESNKIIAKFLGLTIITDEISLFDTNYKPLAKYHENWNDLMPVVEKINKWNPSIRPFVRIPEFVEITITPTKVILKGMIWTTEDKNKGTWVSLKKTFKGSNINSVYQAVIEFIKWYNNEHNKRTKNN